MSKFAECMETYKSEFKKMNVSFNEDLLTKVAKGCGPSIYNKDASTVAGSDKAELETVKKNFLIGKLGLSDSPKLDDAIAEVMETMGSSNRNKYRAMVYYLLATKLGKESVYNN